MATNPYYQRAFNALAGSLARARQMVNEFQLVQNGFDLIGTFTGATKYQLSCSDLTSDLEVNTEAAYFRVQRALTLVEVRASLLTPSASGSVQINMTVNGLGLLAVPITIDQGELTSTTAAVLPELAILNIPDDAVIVISIVATGAGAKGLIVSMLGTVTNLLPAP
jgi:hypothetical protein